MGGEAAETVDFDFGQLSVSEWKVLDLLGLCYVTAMDNLQIKITACVRNFPASVRESTIASNVSNCRQWRFSQCESC